MKKLLWVIGVLILLALLFWAFNSFIYGRKQKDEGLGFDYKNSRFLIDGKFVTLKDGVSEVPVAPGSATMVTTRYFGNSVEADVDGDGDTDMVFLVTHNPGGSGTFYYAVGAIKEEGGWRGTPGVLLGDRIAPQTTEFRDERVIVNYAVRRPTEPMTTSPSVGKSMYLEYNTAEQKFDEVAS
ncbi:MAG: hypothetical protein AAB367_02690 [Patescibacteria group bacterium]